MLYEFMGILMVNLSRCPEKVLGGITGDWSQGNRNHAEFDPWEEAIHYSSRSQQVYMYIETTAMSGKKGKTERKIVT